MKFRNLMLAALAALLLVFPVFSASAQGCPQGLSAEDCTLMEEATAAFTGTTAFKMESWSFNLTVSGLPGTPDTTVEVTGDGVFDSSKVVVDANDPLSFLKGLVLALNMQAKLTGPQELSGDLELRIVNDTLYAKGEQATQGQWQKVPLDQLAGAAGGSLPIDPSMLGGMMGMGEGAEGLNALFASATTWAAEDGPTIGGVSTRAISQSIDLSAVVKTLTSPEGLEALKGLMAMTGQQLDDAQLQQLTAFVPMLEPVLKGVTIKGVNYYGTDKTFRGLKLELGLALDQQGAALIGFPGAVNMQLMLDVRLTDLGQAVTVEAPIE
ncbi:MAG: hypothetical protein OHK0023_07750 [Anaerolineae bacterium]